MGKWLFQTCSWENWPYTEGNKCSSDPHLWLYIKISKWRMNLQDGGPLKWKEITQELVEKLDMSKSSRIENIISKNQERDNKGEDWRSKI